eukprot:353933-Chlamydomonas_euryale.AAC.2
MRGLKPPRWQQADAKDAALRASQGAGCQLPAQGLLMTGDISRVPEAFTSDRETTLQWEVGEGSHVRPSCSTHAWSGACCAEA